MRILTFALFFLSFSALAQNNSINVYPWNPDSDNDNQIGVDDLQSFLTVYGNSFGLPPEPCTYDGTPLEELLGGIFSSSIIIDSLFVEYELIDSNTYYIAGCPNPITETIVFADAVILTPNGFNNAGGFGYEMTGSSYGGYNQFKIFFEGSTGEYQFRLGFGGLNTLGFVSDGFFGSSTSSTDWVNIPLPSDWYIDEDGFHFESAWGEEDWAYYANYLHILPYWHYADE
jgi:hypothetical protein